MAIYLFCDSYENKSKNKLFLRVFA
jgi:hypothetical protein